MAKKSKRKVSTGNVPAQQVADATVVETPATGRGAYTSRRILTSTEFNPDYSNVVADLKRIGVLASAFLVVLVILSFIL